MSELRIIPHEGERVESGPVQFGEDWPGLFLRGDMAGPLSMYLKDVLDSAEDGVRPHPIHMGYAREIVRMLGSCDVRSLRAASISGGDRQMLWCAIHRRLMVAQGYLLLGARCVRYVCPSCGSKAGGTDA